MDSNPPSAPPDVPAKDELRERQPRGTADPNVLQLFAEDASVARRNVETGRVRIARVTHTRDQLIDELLARTSVEVTRIPIGRPIEAIPAVTDDGDVTVIPVVEETLVVERRLVLKEEVHIRRVRTTERYQETVKLRHQTAEVTRIPAKTPAAGDDAAGGSTPQRKTEDS